MNKLTVLAWLCGDTGRVTGDLRDAIRRDLEELREGARLAGESVAVWAAYDDGEDTRAEDCRSGLSYAAPVAKNMADPRNLMEFCDSVMELAPAEQYALIIGGHGSGIKKQDVYRGDPMAIIEKAHGPRLRVDYSDDPTIEVKRVKREAEHPDASWQGMDGALWAGDVPSLRDHIAEGSKMVPAFRSRQWVYDDSIITAKADIAFDDGSRQAMSVADLGLVCRHIAERGPLALVLLDACYMATVEVCEALAGSAEVLVASPGAIPSEGFPYMALLQSWTDDVNLEQIPDCLPSDLAQSAVSHFAEWYTDKDDIASILAVDLKGVPELLAEMDMVPIEWMWSWREKAHRTSDLDFAYIGSFKEPIIDSWASVSAPDAGLTVFLPERGPLPRWWSDLPIAGRPFGQMVKRIVEG